MTDKSFSECTDEEKLERIARMKDNASSMREKYGTSQKEGKSIYFSMSDAVSELSKADTGTKKAMATSKLVGKSLFNVGRFVLGTALPALTEEIAKQNEKSIKSK